MSFYFEHNNSQRIIVSGSLEVPRNGLWYAEFTLEDSEADYIENNPAHVTILDQRFYGHIISGGRYHNESKVRLAGGMAKNALGVAIPGGAMKTVLEPQAYQWSTIELLIKDILKPCGLVIGTPKADLLQVRLPAWSRLAGSAAEALTVLLESHGWLWRALEDGSIGIYDRHKVYSQLTFKLNEDYQEFDYDRILVRYTVATNTRLITHLSGFLDANPLNILHTIDEGKLRTRVWY